MPNVGDNVRGVFLPVDDMSVTMPYKGYNDNACTCPRRDIMFAHAL